MADYFSTLNSQQKSNIAYIIKRMNARGITNPYIQGGILAVVSKESGFVPKSETSYSTTPNSRIRSIFGPMVSKYSEDQLTALKKDDKKFFDAVYGGRFGNTPNEGYKYRGRGFNQLTFKGNYKAVGDSIGVDLVTDPDQLMKFEVATEALLQYFINRFKTAPKSTLAQYNSTGINDFKNLSDAVGAAYHANAGWGKPKSEIDADSTGGRAKAASRSTGFYDMAKQYAGMSLDFLKKKPLMTFAAIAIALTSIFLVIELTKKMA